MYKLSVGDILFFFVGGIVLIVLGVIYKPPKELGYGKPFDLLWTTKRGLLMTGCGLLILALKFLIDFVRNLP